MFYVFHSKAQTPRTRSESNQIYFYVSNWRHWWGWVLNHVTTRFICFVSSFVATKILASAMFCVFAKNKSGKLLEHRASSLHKKWRDDFLVVQRIKKSKKAKIRRLKNKRVRKCFLAKKKISIKNLLTKLEKTAHSTFDTLVEGHSLNKQHNFFPPRDGFSLVRLPTQSTL